MAMVVHSGTPTSRLTRSSGFVAMTRRICRRSFPMMVSPWFQMIWELANEIEPTKNKYLFSTVAQKHPHCWERHAEPYYYVESIWRPISSWWMRFLKISADCAKCWRRKCSLTECWSPTSIFKKFFTGSSIVVEMIHACIDVFPSNNVCRLYSKKVDGEAGERFMLRYVERWYVERSVVAGFMLRDADEGVM